MSDWVLLECSAGREGCAVWELEKGDAAVKLEAQIEKVRRLCTEGTFHYNEPLGIEGGVIVYVDTRDDSIVFSLGTEAAYIQRREDDVDGFCAALESGLNTAELR